MSLFKNAIDAIQIGVEDYLMGDDRRYLSSVRNICAGVLLLYRAHLRSYGVYGTIVNDVNRKEHELLKQSDR